VLAGLVLGCPAWASAALGGAALGGAALAVSALASSAHRHSAPSDQIPWITSMTYISLRPRMIPAR
jgi:hypothetical protein